MKHVLSGDNWTLDSPAAMLFAIAMATEFQYTSDSGETHFDRILSAVGIALLSYVAVFLLGMILGKFTVLPRSWIWLSIVGALVYTLVRVVAVIPHWLDHHQRFYTGSGVTKSQYLLGHLPGMLGFFVVWAASGAIFLIAMRLVFAVLRKTEKENN